MISLVLPFLKAYVPNALRMAATSTGAWLATSGFASAEQGQAVAGAMLVLLSFVWSVAEKNRLLEKIVSS